MSIRISLPITLVLVGSLSASAHAQSTGGTLSTLLPDLILKQIRLPGADNPGRPHAGHFTLGDPTAGGSQAGSRADVTAIGAVEAFADRLRSQFANFPLGSSTGGFTYTYDAALGTYSRRTDSFGPAFTERAITIGKNRFSVGFNFQRTTFDSFGGEDLDDGSITFYLPHTDCCPPPGNTPLAPGFEGDLMEASLRVKANADTFAVFANYGVTDRLDVGVALPITRVDIDATVNARIIRLSTSAAPTVHTFTEGQDDIDGSFSAAGNASGIGDIVVRTKYNFFSSGPAGLAAAVDLRLPTGDADNLLGLGTTQAKGYVIASSTYGVVSPHANFGYTFSGQGATTSSIVFRSLGVSDELNYAGGVDVAVSPRLTVVADVIGRTLRGAGTVATEEKTYQYRAGAGAPLTDPLLTSTTNPLTGQHYRQLTFTPGDLNLVLGSVGAKFNPLPNLLVAGHILVPVTEGGLRDGLTFAFGIDLGF